MRKLIVVIATGLAISFLAVSASAQDTYRVTEYFIGPGSTLVGGGFMMTGAVGQSVTGELSGAGFSLSSGYFPTGTVTKAPQENLYLPILSNR